jgi:hypothetical protein
LLLSDEGKDQSLVHLGVICSDVQIDMTVVKAEVATDVLAFEAGAEFAGVSNLY